MTIKEFSKVIDNYFGVLSIQKEDSKNKYKLKTLFTYDDYKHTKEIGEIVPIEFMDLKIANASFYTSEYVHYGSVIDYLELYIVVED